MADVNSNRHYTRNVIIQFVIALVILVVGILWQREFLVDIYFKDQLTQVGASINAGIALLFLAGIVRVVSMLVRYMDEEKAINRFIRNIRMGDDPLTSVAEKSMVVRRYETLKLLHRKRANINHSALAATLLATESAYNSFPKFVHNTLILTGVFGTIVSLSIALLGASNLIADVTNTGSLGSVIHGMSTALSTTMTAILAYIFFGYFYIKLTDVQTYLISRVEEVTATILLPHLQLSQDAIIKEYSDTVHAATQLVHRFDESQQRYNDAARTMIDSVHRLEEAMQRDEKQLTIIAQALMDMSETQGILLKDNSESLDSMTKLLQKGFRLK